MEDLEGRVLRPFTCVVGTRTEELLWFMVCGFGIYGLDLRLRCWLLAMLFGWVICLAEGVWRKLGEV